MPRGQTSFIFMLFMAHLITGCASTFTPTETSALKIVEADNSMARLMPQPGEFHVRASAPPRARVGESIPLMVQASHEGFLLVCQRGQSRPLHPSLAFSTEWPSTPSTQWTVRLPWVLQRGSTAEISVYVIRTYEDYDVLHYAMEVRDGYDTPEFSCDTLRQDHRAMFDDGGIASTIVRVQLDR